MADPRQLATPLRYDTPIVNPETGTPAPAFVRAWQQSFSNEQGTNTAAGKAQTTANTAQTTATTAQNAINAITSSKSANTFYAAPSAAPGVPTFRVLAAVDLPATTVTPASYTNANITVDAQGRLTAAANGSAGGGTGTVTSLIAGTGLSGGTITTTGTIALANTTVAPASYTNANITVDAQGRITTAANGTAGGTGTVTSIIAGTGLSGGTITTTGTVALANTTVTAASYTNANITVDAQGRITTAANGSAGGAVSITAGTGLTATPTTITGTGSIVMANTTVTPASYTNANITVDAQGRLTAAANGSAGGTLPAQTGNAGKFLTTDATNASWGLAITSVVQGVGHTVTTAGSVATVNLANTTVVPASYTNANITVDAQGRLTAAANGAAGGAVSLTVGTGLTATPTTITATGSIIMANTTVAPGSYTAANITVDAQGRLTAAANGAGGGLSPGTPPTIVQTAVSTGTASNVTFASAPTNGNLLVAFCWNQTNITLVAGWTSQAFDGGGTDFSNVLTKRCGAGELTTQSPQSNAGTAGAMVIFEIAGSNAVVPVLISGAAVQRSGLTSNFSPLFATAPNVLNLFGCCLVSPPVTFATAYNITQNVLDNVGTVRRVYAGNSTGARGSGQAFWTFSAVVSSKSMTILIAA